MTPQVELEKISKGTPNTGDGFSVWKGRTNGQAIAPKRPPVFVACDEKAGTEARTVCDADILGKRL